MELAKAVNQTLQYHAVIQKTESTTLEPPKQCSKNKVIQLRKIIWSMR